MTTQTAATVTAPETATFPEIEIHGQRYHVLSANTPEMEEAEGRFNTAREMRKYGQALDIWLKKPRGRKTFIAYQFNSGNYSSVTPLPRIMDWTE